VLIINRLVIRLFATETEPGLSQGGQEERGAKGVEAQRCWNYRGQGMGRPRFAVINLTSLQKQIPGKDLPDKTGKRCGKTTYYSGPAEVLPDPAILQLYCGFFGRNSTW
jgi:hypothetical protein